MINLAGKSTAYATKQCLDELLIAGVSDVESFDYSRREVQSCITGKLVIGEPDEDGNYGPDCVTITFERAWYYWCVESSKALPKDLAESLNNKYGKEVRLSGFAGGTELSMKRGIGYPTDWHVDTQDGLNALVGYLTAAFSFSKEPLKEWDTECLGIPGIRNDNKYVKNLGNNIVAEIVTVPISLDGKSVSADNNPIMYRGSYAIYEKRNDSRLIHFPKQFPQPYTSMGNEKMLLDFLYSHVKKAINYMKEQGYI